jgi:pimeloyl-ACP methyl ester carboxylesterase
MTSSEPVYTTVGDARVVADHAGDGDKAILCIHGLASQRASLGPLVDVIAEHGYVGLAPDLRGHGTSQGKRGRLSRDRVLADLRAWQDWLATRDVETEAVIGHSLGGLWALAAQRPLEANALGIVASPASILRQLSAIEEVGYRLGATGQRVTARLGLDLKVPYPVGPDQTLASEQAKQRARELDLIQNWIPLANVDDLLAVDGPRWARNVACPSVVARPTRDTLIEEESIRDLSEALPEPKRWIEVDGPHSCFFDETAQTCAKRVVGELVDVMDEQT